MQEILALSTEELPISLGDKIQNAKESFEENKDKIQSDFHEKESQDKVNEAVDNKKSAVEDKTHTDLPN